MWLLNELWLLGCSWVAAISLLGLDLAMAVLTQWGWKCRTVKSAGESQNHWGGKSPLRSLSPAINTAKDQSMSPGATSTPPEHFHRPSCPLSPLAITPIKKIKAFCYTHYPKKGENYCPAPLILTSSWSLKSSVILQNPFSLNLGLKRRERYIKD